MDSGNSGSTQSSSGGDEEFDSSRGESISSFLNPSLNFGSVSTPHTQFLTHQNPTFFDPQRGHNLDHHAFSQSNATTTYNDNNDLIWSRGLRSQHNYGDFGNLTASSSLLSRTQSTAQEGPFPSPSPSVPLRADSEGHASKALLGSDHHLPGVIKKPKKRTRASRRAPTTVLTTDTTNFRQMVQEFTGIPASPLSGSLYSRRLDLFSAAAALRSVAHSDTLGPLHALRPSAHKVLSPFSSSPPTPSLLLNSTMIDSTVPTTNVVSTSNNSNNYPQPSNHLVNLQNQNIPLQLGRNASMTFGNLSGFTSQETPSAATQVGDNDNLTRWKSGETVRNDDGVHENLVTFEGNINSSSGYNLNISEKGVENSVSTAEGNVASWLCSSD